MSGSTTGVVHPELWQSTIDAMRKAMEFAAAEVTVMRLPDGEPIMPVTCGITDEWLPRFQHERSKGAMDLWGDPERIQEYPLGIPAG